jgi:hypothetical protein
MTVPSPTPPFPLPRGHGRPIIMHCEQRLTRRMLHTVDENADARCRRSSPGSAQPYCTSTPIASAESDAESKRAIIIDIALIILASPAPDRKLALTPRINRRPGAHCIVCRIAGPATTCTVRIFSAKIGCRSRTSAVVRHPSGRISSHPRQKRNDGR